MNCVDCGASIAKPRRGKPASRCSACRAMQKRNRQNRNRPTFSTCRHCGRNRDHAGFSPFCSARCEGLARGLPERTCEACGKAFVRAALGGASRRDAGRCCSRECGWDLARSEATKYPRSPFFAVACKACGKIRTGKRKPGDYCDAKCRHAATYIKLPDVEAVCSQCDKPFRKQRGQGITDLVRFCSLRCYRKWSNLLRNKKIDGGERFHPFEVFSRDGWKCRSCGCDAPKSLRGTINSRAPELDHIVPIAAGGAHSKSNTQLIKSLFWVQRGSYLDCAIR